ncbi:alpha/beta hydrolase [Rhodococcus sp. D2-41]|uniref:Alpha/beta hydrolase n=1 Tax=Speluncibacter jeojiensis TaxID=2710754 RepID=A0A9X4M5J7_9ACTN|nr:alpha/beta hydrolase [Rhodococcus sp. D2-41]MDG3009952.1 alpha/beta hydrolase [Rhodococcus sp. D2-41]MDG3016347.1 alpha/beta hydrolase [Corynebacteriales bacterium D3-21]
MAEHSAAVREALSADGTRIVYRVDGPADARPLVLVHGWAQSSACWGPNVLAALTRQFRVVALDLRGHGYSGAPDDGYADPENWAADLAAVLAAEQITSGAVLVGWSYGGLVCCDYLDRRGSEAVAGLVLVGAITGIGMGQHGGRIGKAMTGAMPDALSADPDVAVPALTEFTAALRGTAIGKGDREQALLGAGLATPPRVRAALFGRTVNHDDLLARLTIPVLVMHGTADRVVDLQSARYAVETVPHARASFWEGGGHVPFLENEGRFIGEIGEFVASLPARPVGERWVHSQPRGEEIAR